MLDAIKEALKRHLGKSGHDKPVTHALHDKVDQNHGDVTHGDPAKSEHAPELEPYNNNMTADQTITPQIGDIAEPADDDVQENHQKILEALMNKGGHHGRPASGLGERVADKAKEKYASMEKKKELKK